MMDDEQRWFVNPVWFNQARQIIDEEVRPRYVYVIEALDLEEPKMPGMVKIGTTCDLESRIKAISKGLEFDVVRYLYVVPGDQKLESAMHKAFRDFRVSGEREWFYMDGELESALTELMEMYCVCEHCQMVDKFQSLPIEIQLAINSQVTKGWAERLAKQ